MKLAEQPTLTKEERDLIRKTQEQLEVGLRIAGDILAEQETAREGQVFCRGKWYSVK